jgi:transposase-like protein
MYVNGVSTRKVSAITKELCGFEISSSTVSQKKYYKVTKLQKKIA